MVSSIWITHSLCVYVSFVASSILMIVIASVSGGLILLTAVTLLVISVCIKRKSSGSVQKCKSSKFIIQCLSFTSY